MDQTGRILLVASGKGGTGKSTFSVNCATQLALRGRRVLLIDADAGLRSLDLMLGVADRAVYDLSDVLCGRCDPIGAVLETPRPNLSLLPAPQAECPAMTDAGAVARLYGEYRTFFDYIFIDSPAGVGEEVTAPANAAACVLIVANAEPVCIRSAERLAQIMRVRGAENLRLVLNRIDAKLIRKKLLPDLDTAIDGTAVQLIGVVPEDKQVLSAAASGRQLEKGAAAVAFRNIAARIDGEDVPLMKL